MDYRQFLLDEYLRHGQPPVFCTIAGKKLVVPLSYGGQTDEFLDDIFANEAEAEKYNLQENGDISMLKVGDIYFVAPVNLLQKGMSEAEIVKRSVKRAIRRYKSAVAKTLRAQREYPDETFAVSMEPSYISKLDAKHQKYIIHKLGFGLAKAGKWSASQTVHMIAGVAGAVPAATYYMLDKKVRFADNKAHRFVKETALPYIRQGLLKTLLPVVVCSVLATRGKTDQDAASEQRAGIENVTDSLVNNGLVTEIGETASTASQKFSITDRESFHALFEKALPFLAQSMMPTEILVLNPYADNGKTTNTIGLGSYWYPKDGNPESSEWIKTKDYVKRHPGTSVSGVQAYNLMRGWFDKREGGRIYRELYRRLQGTELTMGELTAICTCIYNDENNGKQLCDFVHENYRDPIKCAAFLMSLKPGNSDFNDGILKRHAHEALTYLNLNNYCDKVPYFMVKEGTNSKGQKYYVTSVTQLTPEICRQMSDDLAAGKTDAAVQVAQLIYNYRCKDGQSVYEIGNANGLGMLFNGEAPLDVAEINRVRSADELYGTALQNYKDGNYPEALQGFQNMVAQGYNSADIHNDMAITYYKMGKYEDCIRECREILKTGETEQYAPANYNAGLAYERLGNNERALQNYKEAEKREPDNNFYKKAVSRLSSSVKSVRPQKTH